jgi:hypothetical protein
MRQIVEVAWESLCKYGEELCGDCVKIVSNPTSLTVVLSDGLGSGVKANILATLTAQIAASMFEQGATINEVIGTLIETLPECKVRKLAYATFAMLRVNDGREAYLVEYDSPPLIHIRNGEVVPLEAREEEVNGRKIREARFTLQEKDYMIMVSDGYIHAGVGGLYRLGWGYQNLLTSVKRWAQTGGDAFELTQALAKTCNKLYNGKPGDDATAVAMLVRPSSRVTVWSGPPANPEADEAVVRKLMEAEGVKVICGGTTAQIASRILGQELKVEWVPPKKRTGAGTRKKGTPPVAKMPGVDLVTEGILTLGQAADHLERVETYRELPRDEDAATRLAAILLSVDEIHFIIGMALNPYQVADQVRGEPMRMVYIKELVRELEKRKKMVTIEKV